ncbi:hypothetical protein FIA58_010495 [Flavobacterium jejuense]|uniref:Uncharacterized protein n=1 Tax=Flavobacterium jejuense TaxID=1544455 RepID=A0ABX0IQK7_9FLAO|nr:hypothetical protein [Flavobacterium jejuense]NHN26105.1 hypothetical protein [Flavobacterium jejuense]
MEEFNYWLWLSILCMTLGAFFSFKASEFSGRKVEQKLDRNIKVSELNNDKLGVLTGQGSFPLARVWNYSKDMEKTNLNIQLLGANPLLNIEVWGEMIENYSESKYPIDVRPFTLNAINPKPNLKIDRLINGSNKTNIITIPTIKNEHCIMLFYQGDNTSWGQYIFRTKVGEKFETLNIIVDNERKVLFKDKSSGFPTTKDGYVFLNSYAKFKYENLENSRIDFHPNNLKKQ